MNAYSLGAQNRKIQNRIISLIFGNYTASDLGTLSMVQT